MFHVYDDIYRITDNPVSYNFLFSIINKKGIEWNKVSTLPLYECYTYDNIKIVRVI